jgi:predicted membrane chloride channel (bestrophin family)
LLEWLSDFKLKVSGRTMIKTIVFSIWVFLVIGWNYGVPGATPFEDVLVAICLSLFAGFLEKHSKRKWCPKRREPGEDGEELS